MKSLWENYEHEALFGCFKNKIKILDIGSKKSLIAKYFYGPL